MKYAELPIELVQLDLDNPRIKQYIDTFKEINSEVLSLALSGSSSGDASSKYRALRDSIKENGGIFTPIIVNHKTDTDEYIVIEGNTRLQFYMEFKKKDPNGPWTTIISIVYDDMPEEQIHAIRLQAHMVGARDWDAYSKAKYLDYLYNTEHRSMTFLKNFCGGQESYIISLIDAYQDMVNYYLPYCEQNGYESDPQKFSYYVELQKSNAKNALFAHNYDVTDFTKWVVNEKIDRAEHVRKLAKVLGEEYPKNVFLKSTMGEAIKKLDDQDSELKKIKKTNLYSLIKEVTIKLRNLSLKEFDHLKDDPKFDEKKESIIDLYDEIAYVKEKIEEDI